MESSGQSRQIFAVVQTKIEKFPYAEENDEYMPGFLRVYSESQEIGYDESRDFTFDSWEELVEKVYQARGISTPKPVRPLNEVIETVQSTPEGDQFLIDDADSYLSCYSLEISDVYWIRKLPVFAAFCPTPEAAEEFIERHRYVLHEPRVQSVPMERLLDEQIG